MSPMSIRNALMLRSNEPELLMNTVIGGAVGYQMIVAPRPDNFIRTLDGLTQQVQYPLCYMPSLGAWFVLTKRGDELYVKWARDELRLMNFQWEEYPRPQ